jgi:phosphoribosylanthranilate isomerase
MKIKICGITNKHDALNAIALNIHAIGFIFHKHSPRYVSPETLESFMLDIPPFISTVGVFVNSTHEEIMDTVRRCKLNTIQLHGDESPEFCMQFDLPIIKAFRIKEESDLKSIPQYKGIVNGYLLDTKVENIHGGTGKTFDWGLAIEAKLYDIPLILSGGINAENVGKAIKMVQPYAIDLSSGVEKEPGIKDYQKIKNLIQASHQIL